MRLFPTDRPLYFDGGMGTLLQAKGLAGGERPETWNVTRPEVILGIHAAYLAAGCDVVTANTFGASAPHLGDRADDCLRAGLRLARQAVADAGRGLVAMDAGSLGRLVEPLGDLPYEEAIAIYRHMATIAVGEGADVLLAETMTDLREVKAAVLGYREALAETGARLPIVVSLSFDTNGRLLTGASVEAASAMLCGMGVDAVGMNCHSDPEALMPNLRRLLACCERPVLFMPNASLPVVKDGETIYPTTPERFAEGMAEAARLGANALGGCCGTTPEHIRLMVDATRDIRPTERPIDGRLWLSGRGAALALDKAPVLIGERLNPTGKPRMKQALREGNIELLLREGLDQLAAGAHALDVNVGLPEIDETAMLPAVVQALQGVCDAPLQLDTADPEALASALRVYVGKPLINSVSGKQAVMDAVFPLVERYGGAVVALLLDEQGIPATVEGRLAIAERIIAEAAKHGVPKRELLFDALTLTVSTDPTAADVTLETVRRLTRELGVRTVLGVSNVSFGLPQRPLLTSAFLAMAVREGLSAAILNPLDALTLGAFDAACAVCGMDEGFARYIGAHAGAQTTVTQSASAAAPTEATTSALQAAILKGLRHDAENATRALLADGREPLAIVEGEVMPALSEVGERFERGRFFLPQLLQSAAAAQSAFDVLRAAMPPREGGGFKVALATVRGDVHDIGKNIVKVLLQNYGFDVLDLGRDAPPEKVLACVRETGATLVGLSALMTTTVPAMRETIALLRREAPGTRVIVGGAVLTEDYARQIGADAYGKDAMATVRYAKEIERQTKGGDPA